MSNPTIILAAGGTGGHLFPAVALSEELLRRGATVDLMTDARADKYLSGFPGRDVHIIDSSTIGSRGLFSIFTAAKRIRRGIAQANTVLNRVNPSVILGFGGYPTLPPILAARKHNMKRAVHEANAVMGRANRMLAPFVHTIATSFEETKHATGGLFAHKIRVTGNPVRDAIIVKRHAPYTTPAPGEPIRLSVFGGSQGARIFSDIVPEAMTRLPEELRARLLLTQQCRPEDLDRVEAFYKRAGINAELASFFDNMPDRLAATHLTIARAGASTITELAVIGRPSLLVPLPHSVDNDQLLNARHLSDRGGAWHVDQKELTPEKLAGVLSDLLGNPEALAAAARAAHAAGKPDAVRTLADLVEELAGESAAPRSA